MYEELFKKAKDGDTDALRQLRQRIEPHLTVFVVRKGELDVEDSLAAFDYYRRYQVAPAEWGDDDAPTCAIDQAFIEKVRKDPIKLMPLTGGVWAKLWKHESGHKWIAAFYWGKQAGHLKQSTLELKAMAEAILDGNPGLMSRVAEKMEQMGATQRAMDMVFSEAKIMIVGPQPICRDKAVVIVAGVAPGVAKRAALQKSLDELESEKNSGMIDIGRYMRLQASITADYRAASGSKWTRAKVVAFNDFLRKAYNLSELKTLCFRVGLDHENLGGSGKSGKVRSFIEERQRRSLLDEVGEICKRERPAVWAELMRMHE